MLPAHSILVADDGRIHKICPAAEMDVFVAELAEAVDAIVDCTNKCVLPGACQVVSGFPTCRCLTPAPLHHPLGSQGLWTPTRTRCSAVTGPTK